MESETLVSVVLTTHSGIDIYSAHIIDQYSFYKQTLDEAQLAITILNDEYPYSKLLFRVHEEDDLYHFRSLYGKEFDSSSNHQIFGLLEHEYQKRFGHKIIEGPVFSKYNELFRKTKIAEKQTTEIYKSLNARSKTKLAQSRSLDKIFSDLAEWLKTPHQNETLIIKTIEDLLGSYLRVLHEEKDEDKERLKLAREGEDKKNQETLTIKKNNFGQFVYEKYNLIFDPKSRTIIGTANKMGGVYPLDRTGIDLCKKLKLQWSNQ
jgi:hypothetical protein